MTRTRMIKTSARLIAKEAGITDNLFFRRKHVAVLFGSAGRKFLLQAVPANLISTDLLSAFGSRTAPADAAGVIRQALPQRGVSRAFKSLRGVLTEHKNLNRDGGERSSPTFATAGFFYSS